MEQVRLACLSERVTERTEETKRWGGTVFMIDNVLYKDKDKRLKLTTYYY